MTRKQKKNLARILIAGILMALLHFLPIKGLPRFFLYLLPYLCVGYDVLIKAWKGICNRQVFDENFLMALATVGALAIGLFRTGDYVEAVAVMLFYQVGELFQSYAVGKSRRNIVKLMDIRPDYANIEQDGRLVSVDPDEITAGTVIVVQPGERIPIDGIVEEGYSALNTSALTGESMPRDVAPGEEVISGCINMTGLLKVRTTREFGQSTVTRILELVENASSRKSRSEDFIAKFARYYTPIVCYCALALAVLPPVIRLFCMGLAPLWGEWFYRALTFLVISCPCALVISIPLTFFAGIGGASNAGILVKGSNYLEALSKAGIVVFDKTGTLTQGAFQVTSVHSEMPEETALLELAALAECASSHPISKSIQSAWGKPLDRSRVEQIREISGHGVIARVDGQEIAVGNQKLMDSMQIRGKTCQEPGTTVHLAINGRYAGYILVADVMKPDAPGAIGALRKAGVRKTVMLTGDNEASARHIAAQLDIDSYCSELLPDGKVEKVEQLLVARKNGELLVFVGDGINDAPVLSLADIGIAMGAMGSDAAIEAADVVLMDDHPGKVAKAIGISRKCMAIVYQNIIFAIGIKVLCLVLGAVGIANMGVAIFADVGVMVLAVLNAIRALFVKKL